jgi:hypothetical protein
LFTWDQNILLDITLKNKDIYKIHADTNQFNKRTLFSPIVSKRRDYVKPSYLVVTETNQMVTTSSRFEKCLAQHLNVEDIIRVWIIRDCCKIERLSFALGPGGKELLEQKIVQTKIICGAASALCSGSLQWITWVLTHSGALFLRTKYRTQGSTLVRRNQIAHKTRIVMKKNGVF